MALAASRSAVTITATVGLRTLAVRATAAIGRPAELDRQRPRLGSAQPRNALEVKVELTEGASVRSRKRDFE